MSTREGGVPTEFKMADRKRTRGHASIATVEVTSPVAKQSTDNKEVNVSVLEMLMARFDKFEKVIENKIDDLDEKFSSKIEELDNKIGERIETIDSSVRQAQAGIVEAEKGISQINTIIEDNKIGQDQNRQEIELLKQKLNRAEEARGKLNNKVNELEDKSKFLNIKIEGKNEEEEENLIDYIQNMTKIMGLSGVGPADYTASRIGRKNEDRQGQTGKARKPRIIMINFNNHIARNKFYYARSKLGNSREYKGVYLNDDVSIQTMKHRDGFRAVAALARKYGDEVRVHGDGIIINKTKYRYDDALPDKYALSKAKVVEINGQIYFQSEYAHLSNFHPAPIRDKDIYYPTAEHHYQAAKCKQAGDMIKYHQILKAETPLEAKRIGDSIQETIEWRRQKEMKMEITINLKYDQNPKLAKLLLDTQDMKLNEATGNTFFGIGATLHSKALRDRSYGGLNKLGLILENKRSEMSNK